MIIDHEFKQELIAYLKNHLDISLKIQAENYNDKIYKDLYIEVTLDGHYIDSDCINIDDLLDD